MQPLGKRLFEFLFPAESDNWLGVLRLGLGLQVTLYSLSLRNDWNYLLAGTGQGLISRDLAEALLSVESHFNPLRWMDLFIWCRLQLTPGTFLPCLCDSGLVSSPMRSQERRVRVIWR